MKTMAMDSWIRSGMAQEAARDLVWFVIITFVVVGFLIWRSEK